MTVLMVARRTSERMTDGMTDEMMREDDCLLLPPCKLRWRRPLPSYLEIAEM